MKVVSIRAESATWQMLRHLKEEADRDGYLCVVVDDKPMFFIVSDRVVLRLMAKMASGIADEPT